MGQRVYEMVYGLFLHLCVVETDPQVGGQVELTCQVAQNALEEGVDGLYPEVAVVVQQQVQGFSCTFLDGSCGQLRLLDGFLQILF